MAIPGDDAMQRVRSSGVRGASVVDLIAIGFARRETDVPLAQEASRKLLQRIGSLRALHDASSSLLQDATGLDEFELIRSQALIELGRRMGTAGKGPHDRIEGPQDVADLLDFLRHEKREHFYAVLLDAKNNLIRSAEIHIGTLTASIVGAREIFREAVRDGASSMIVSHNHPSGDPAPSREDIEVTQRLVEIGKLLDIPVLDHVIIGERRFVSLAQEGLVAF